MHYWMIVLGLVIYGGGNPLMKMATGIRPKGWAFWFYDAPAFVSGILLGAWLILNFSIM